jgi:NADPH:quinone reductase-like Zn-dependent oxidoreductase
MVSAGDIEAAGEDVKRFTPGNSVYTFNISRFGAYAEYMCLPEDGVIAPKPSNLTYEEAAAIPYGGMLALHFLKLGGIQNGQKVLIFGASGAVGTSAVQLAKYFGAHVTGVCSTGNIQLVRSLGVDEVIDYTKEDFASRGELYDFIFNVVGKRKAKLRGERALTPHGKHITVDDGRPKLYAEHLVPLKELVEGGHLKPVIDRCYPLEQIVEAHRYVDKGHKKGNVVMTVDRRSKV